MTKQSLNTPLGNHYRDQLARIDHYLFDRLLPLWRDNGIDRQHGGFYERLDSQLQPLSVDTKRLLVQCRQIFVYSLAFISNRQKEDAEAAKQGFSFLQQHFLDRAQGGWFFSVHNDGRVRDSAKDAYGHAFVLFACAYYYRAFKDEYALQIAFETSQCLLQQLTDTEGGGFFEAAESDWKPRQAIRRQNPHMHLLEAFVALYQNDPSDNRFFYQAQADNILQLFGEYFFDDTTDTLGEFFNDQWCPDNGQGHRIEPGHHYEWYWLLSTYDQSQANPILRQQAEALYAWADRYGCDSEHGGIFNEVDRNGRILDDAKRIWPVTECLKARALRYQLLHEAQDLHKLCELLDYLFAYYLQEDGRWHEYLNRDNSPKPYDLPGSTGYHIVLGLMEARRVLNQQSAQ
ncbi:AGE family epimerase/isomerase [Aestuariirhabdus sp. Z084]|uniref:AGE family epimerase/isomerase n=1 Tax=Aestuariirhabdus haliotis TaxID=2918751 RepID=UPI00201B4314|nr:AGE family epimerase/isomerase [Aestuariirhabdus haliotis]MCL6417230.1 AGE family epimerase/isomerase [Aestuariirhabdus haliotis]MCL6421205.1 AGE family epimerase/isomerase [Aestuariirhabdus haliotis]